MNILSTAKDLLGAVAPTLGTALGGPMGGMAGKMIADALGVDNNEKAIGEAIANATPEQLAQIKKIEADFKVQMKQLDVDLDRIHASDRDSARKREIETGDRVPAILAIMTMVSFFAYIAAVTFVPAARDADIGFINIAVGWLGGTASTVVAYYFGSSSGSAKKDKLIVEKK